MQWSCDVHEARNKPPIVGLEAEKRPQFRQSLWRWPVAHGLHFLGLHLYPFFRQVAQEIDKSLKQQTFVRIQLQACRPKSLKHLSQTIHMTIEVAKKR